MNFASRRAFLLAVLSSAAGFVSTGFARTVPPGIPWQPGQADAPRAVSSARFFNSEERACVGAIAARIIPTDEHGPGAREAGVVDFIDRQLAGFYGRGDRWYMQGPFSEGLETQGYQSEFAPAALYREAVAALDAHCRSELGGRFADLAESNQDGVLKGMQGGQLKLPNVSAKAFFSLVKDNTIEGFFSDPIHGGNRDMVGWKLVGFPGARYDYRDFLNHDGSPIAIEPVSLAGRPAWNPR